MSKASEEVPTVQSLITPTQWEDDPVLKPGTRVDNWVVDRKLASGGFATVYTVFDAANPVRKAAIKVLFQEMSRSPVMVERFSREVRSIEAIGHPDIVQIYGMGLLGDGRPYYAMELLEGSNLRDLIRARHHLAPHEVLELITPVGRALSAAHAAGILHRDIKSTNVVVAEVDGVRVVKLVDFGIAKILTQGNEPGLTAAGERLGSLSTMSPEQIVGGPLDARSDVYSLGVMLFQMLTGRYPFQGKDDSGTQRDHLEAPAPAPSKWVPLTPEIDRIILRCLQKKPADRYPSVAALMEDLQRVLSDKSQPLPQIARPVTSLAVYLELLLPAGAEEAPDDALLVDMGGVLDLAEQTLKDKGLHIALATQRAVLAVRAPVKDEATLSEGLEVLEVAEALYERLTHRASPDARVAFRLLVDSGPVDFIEGAAQPVSGGALLDVTAWAPQPAAPGLWARPPGSGPGAAFQPMRKPTEP